MQRKIMSLLICIVIVTSVSATITQNVGQTQNIDQPSVSTSGTVGLTNSSWPMFSCNAQRTGLSPYNTSGNDGQLKWKFTTSYIIQSSPIIDSEGTIYIHDNNDILYAINSNGIEKWNNSFSGITRTPAIDSHGTIYIGSYDNRFYAINPNGTEKWNFTTGEAVKSSPAIGSDGTIYLGTSNIPILFALNPDGTEKWRFRAGLAGQTSSPGIGLDGTIYVGSSDYNLYAINPNGTEKWRFTTGGGVQTAPAIGSEGTIYVGSNDYNLYAINPDGTEKWNFTTGWMIHSSPAIGSDGTIYVGSWDKNLYAIGSQSLEVNVTSHFSILNSAAQSAITVHVTDGTYPVQGATVNLSTNNGGIFWPQSGATDSNGNFTSIFNAPTVITQTICRITANASKTGYNNDSRYIDVTINPVPWPMFSHDCRSTCLSPYDTSRNPGKLKWSFKTGSIVGSSPTVGSDETIYVGSWDNKLYAIYPNGTEKWNFPTGDLVSSPTIGSDGTIYAGSTDYNLYAINPNSTKKWNFTTGGSVKSSPVIGSDGTIYIGTAGNDSKLYAISPDGIKKWDFKTGGGQVGSPAIGYDATIYVGSSDYNLYAINPDGTEKWRFPASENMQSRPTIDSDGTIYVGSHDHNLYAIYPNGTKKWVFTTGGSIGWGTSAALDANGTIYVGSDDYNLYAINPNGTEKWRFKTGSLVQTAPAIGADGTIYIGSSDNNLYAVNSDGTEKWNFTTGWFVGSSPAIGSDATIYVGSWDGKLYAIGGKPDIPPIADAGQDLTVNEGDIVQFNGSASYDPDGTIKTYDWDFDASDGLWWETGMGPDATDLTPNHVYSDDGFFIVTLKITDDQNLSDTDICNVTVLNVNPTGNLQAFYNDSNVSLFIRIAGEKWHDVIVELYKNDNIIANNSLIRYPGSPNNQMLDLSNYTMNSSDIYRINIRYTPEDDAVNGQPNGATPCWVILNFSGQYEIRLHHTFNVKHPDTYIWEVNLTEVLLNQTNNVTFIVDVYDPGSDDITLFLDFGDGTNITKFYTNLNGSYPVVLNENFYHQYSSAGTFNITLIAKDDDGGVDIINISVNV